MHVNESQVRYNIIMKNIKFVILITLLAMLVLGFSLVPKSEINFKLKLIDGDPKNLPFAEGKHTYPLRYATLVRGSYGALEFNFETVQEKDPKTTIIHQFMFDLPDIEKLGITTDYVDGKKEYVAKIEELPLTLTEKDYANLPKTMFGNKIYTSIYIYKDIRKNVTKSGIETVESVNVIAPFDKFTLTIHSYEIKDSKLYMSASFKGKTVEDEWGWYPYKYEVEADFTIAGAKFRYKMVD